MNIERRTKFSKIIFLIILFDAALITIGAGSRMLNVQAQVEGNGYSNLNTFISDGISFDKNIINGPSSPPPGFELERAAVDLTEPSQSMALATLTVPAYSWVFGSSAVSGAMIAGFYDRNGFQNMYTGPTDGGVMPLDNSSWPTWSDGSVTYPNLPLAATHNGVDGRVTRGSIDDYWITSSSSAQDPYITYSWTQHTWGEAIGDYMKTSQSAFSNTDGSTTFFNYTSQPSRLTCAIMETTDDGTGHMISERDGTYGRKLFYEVRGYTVTDCYNQKTDNNGGGFTLAMYKAEIDAGRPVMLNLAGHTIVGVGYDNASTAIFIHDTWDYADHSMIWGGSYSGMPLRSVSIVNLQPVTIPPGAFIKTSPANGAIGISTNTTLAWEASSNATSYEYCYATISGCANWTSAGTATSVGISGLINKKVYYWQVRAINAGGSTMANTGTYWSFSTVSIPKLHLPLVLNNYVTYFLGPWEFELNNDYQYANGPLRSSQDYYGYPNDEKDFFSIQLNASGNITIDLTGVPNQGMQLQLYDHVLTKLKYAYEEPYHIAYANAPAGIYYICVYTTPERQNSDTRYTLRVIYP